jgi:hypothetical protein
MTRTSSRCLYNQAGTLQIGYKLQTVVDSLLVSFPIDAFDLDRPASKRQELARPELFGAGFQHPASAWPTGKFYLFTTDGEGTLGNVNGTSDACSLTGGTCRSDVFLLNLEPAPAN